MILRRNKIRIMDGCYWEQRKEGPNEKRSQNETPAWRHGQAQFDNGKEATIQSSKLNSC
jgi:hypothetical protein